ncbi:hypothetical protein [Neisseria sicca]|uniref:hypothetical protein n=1 Tax=Neisseria sicca TaxID=490 RepID=UPI001649D847|nr:hypothetical protein [Neisseria sicca]
MKDEMGKGVGGKEGVEKKGMRLGGERGRRVGKKVGDRVGVKGDGKMRRRGGG